jgi:hypothetical protein
MNLESPNTVQQQMHAGELLARQFSIRESRLPFPTGVRIGHNRALQMREGSFRAGPNVLLHVRQQQRHLSLKGSKLKPMPPRPFPAALLMKFSKAISASGGSE